jgi:hypothetical protein
LWFGNHPGRASFKVRQGKKAAQWLEVKAIQKSIGSMSEEFAGREGNMMQQVI